MALVVKDRVQETSTTSGTGTLTLAGAVPGFQTFSSSIGNGNTTFYTIYDNVAQAWEVGIGTVGAGTLSRDTVLSNSSGGTSPLTLAGNSSSVFCTYPAEKSVNLNALGNVSPLGTISSGTWQGSTIGVAYGGTGVTTSSGANSVVLRDADQNITVNRVNQANTNTTAAGGTTALTTASSYIQSLVGTGGQTYTLPDATTLTTGVAFVFNNLATGTLTIQDYAAATIGTIPSGGAGAVFLTANPTVGGTWDLHAYLPEGVTFGTNSFNLGSAVITGGTWNGGTIGTAYGGTGLTTFSAANYALYSTSSSALTAGTLPTAAGGTALTSFTSGGALYATSTSALTTGTLPATSGGTGIATYTTGDIIYASATNTLSKLPIGTAGQVLSVASGIPSWTANPGSTTLTNTTFTATAGQTSFSVTYTPALLQGVYRNGVKLDPTDYDSTSGSSIVLNTGANLGDNIQVQYFSGLSTVAAVNSITFGSTGLTPSIATSGNVTVAGTLNVANGGTGVSSATAYALLAGGTTSTGAFQSLASVGTSGQVLVSNGAGALPTFQTVTAGATISNDTSTSTDRFPLFASATTGTPTTIFTSNAKYLYKPSTGDLQASQVAASNGIMLNNATIATSYTIPSGYNASSVGPVTLSSGVSVTVPAGSRYIVL